MSQGFDRDFLVLLHDLARMLRTRFDQRAREHGATRAQWLILARLDRQPGLSQNELAGICEVEPISIARLVDKLEARGLVERRPDPTDRRIWRLHNSPAAKPIIEQIKHYREAINEELLQGIDLEERERLIDALINIKCNLAGSENQRMAAAGE